MFSGKTSRCLAITGSHRAVGHNVLMIKPELDTRDQFIASHDGGLAECKRLDKLIDAKKLPEYEKAFMIVVDEAQFFDDILEGVEQFLKDSKKIFVFALDGDAKQRPFGKVSSIIPLCDTVEKLNGLCQFCGKNAPFTTSSTELPDSQILIGGQDIYTAVCRNHVNI
jgi:thymidine kinase